MTIAAQRLLGAAEAGDVGDPVEGRAELAQLLEAPVVVRLLDVAGLGGLPVALGQPGLVRQDRAAAPAGSSCSLRVSSVVR